MSSKFKQFGLVFSGICIGVMISLNFAARADRETPVSTLPVEQSRKLAEAFNYIKRFYVDSVDDKKLLDDAISGMVAGLDPHSTYLDEEGNKEMDESIKGEFGGLGLQVEPKDGYVRVESPIEGTPAFRAGMKSGDLIIKIDNVTVKGLSLTEAVKKMRGVPGSKVTLSVFREGATQPFDVPLVREVIQVRSVRSKIVEPGYAYVRVAQFQERTVPDLVSQLIDLDKKGPLKGLVLDLRNDPGGLLDGAVGVSAAFLKRGALVVYTDGRAAGRRDYNAVPEEYSRGGGDLMQKLPESIKSVPLVVLVNGGSASASEIVSGALQDYKRATIMGTPTFGKASVQTKFDFPDGKTAMKLTIARYFTPKGRSIQAKGIEPDVVVEDSAEGERFKRLREADLPRHLLNPKEGQSEPFVLPAEPELKKDVSLKPPPEFGSKEDWQLSQALLQLKGLPLAVPAAASAPVAATTPAKK